MASAPRHRYGVPKGTARDRIAAAIEGRALDDKIVRDITAGVHAIHPDMVWELAPGRTAQHAFCISPEGRADLRQIALRWLETAPPADANWEYHASKQASERLTTLQIGSTTFDLGDMRAITSSSPRARADAAGRTRLRSSRAVCRARSATSA